MTAEEYENQADLERLYVLLNRLREEQGGYRYLQDCTIQTGWPDRGVYFFFENGETRTNGRDLRVVRVGTHAVSQLSKTTLWKRLQQHRGSPNGGNHRGSVFRLHVGGALLACGEFPSEIALTWGQGSSAGSDEVRTVERPLEQAVSTYIGNMPLLVLAADDTPGPASIRAYIERNAIALLSNLRNNVVDSPSRTWLGCHCPHAMVCASGLWNVNYVNDDYDPAFLNCMEVLVEDQLKK